MALISSNGTGGGNWSAAGTWVGGVPPAEGDCATVVVGDTVTIDNAAPANVIIGDDHVGAAYAITINGKLQYLSTAAIDHVFRCKGDLVIALGGTLEIGTVANPIPAARTFTIELNYSAALADGKYGLKNSGDMVLQGDPARITVTNCLLNADAAVNDNALTTDVATGWKDNDDIAIASTTRTWTEAENGKMNGDAVGTALTIDGFGGVGGGLANAHSGTSPTQAEIINLTRNVKVTSFNTGFRGYVCCYLGSTSNVDYTEFYMIGVDIVDKYGITIKTTAVMATNFAYCSVWGHATSNFSFYLKDAEHVVLDYINVYNTHLRIYAYSGRYNTLTHSIFMKVAGTHGCQFKSDPYATIENNVFTSNASYGLYLYGIAPALSVDSNVAHSNGSYGIYQNTSISQSNLTLWRNNNYGLRLAAKTFTIDTITAFGNANANIYLNAVFAFDFLSLTLGGDSTFSTPYGIYLESANVDVLIEDSDIGSTSGIMTTHSSADIYYKTGFHTISLKNTKLGSATEISNIHNADSGSYCECEDLDQVQYNDKAWYKYGIVVRDNSTFKTGSYSIRFDQFWAADDWLEYEVEIPVKDGESVVVSAWLRKNAAYTSANRPKIKLSGMGITATEDQMSNVTDVWEKVSVSGTPTRTGMAKLTIMTYLTNAGASAWCDFEKTGLTMPVLNTLEGSFWADGHFAQILFDTGSITAKEFWETLLADVNKAGSFANLIEDYLDVQLSLIKAQTDKVLFDASNHIKSIAQNAELAHLDANISSRSSHTAVNVRDEILSDATKFGGAYIDALISSRASPSDILANITKKVPADLEDVPTDSELDAKHGSGSWEGTTLRDVADAVWEEPHGEHEDELTFGGLMKLILNAARKVFISIRKR